MDDKLRTIEFDTELSPEEEAAIDRLLTEAAEADDSEVDYPAMLARIKAAAKEEGIVIFPSRKEKRARIVKRVFTGFAAVAAVFILGFTVLTATKVITPFDGFSSKTAFDDAHQSPSGDVIVPGEHHGGKNDVGQNDHPSSTAYVPSSTVDPVIVTPDPIIDPEVTPSPDQSGMVVEPTPVPTEIAERGSLTGYVWLGTFLGDPADPMYLVPGELPDFMEAEQSDVELFVRAEGKSEEGYKFYSCRVLAEYEVELMIGAARYRANDTGSVHYLWRVTDYTFLEVELIGFDRAEAESLLISLPLIDPTTAAAPEPDEPIL